MPVISLVSTTFSSESECVEFAETILALKLCACCQITQISSVYMWKAKLNNEKEFKLECKTLNSYDLVDYIKNHHTYDTPEIVVQKLETTDEYYNFVASNQG